MKFIIFVFTIFLLSGCSINEMWYGSPKARLSYVTLEGLQPAKKTGKTTAKTTTSSVRGDNEDKEKPPKGTRRVHLGTIISWSPEFNAAYVTDNGKGCIQPAAYAKTNSGNVSIPTSISVNGDAENQPAQFSQALTALMKVTNQSTFLSVGLYGICQLHANGGLTKAQSEGLVKELIVKALSVPTDKPDNDDGITPPEEA